ncbi:hypothetical protein EDB86DRAFT_3075722 [Lactarius hatsudake]|nr:hypothetical protein EDB86DRAFT_3075722 [Lactarius hatsudake]
MSLIKFLHTLTGPIPTPFFGDPAQAQRFIDEFGRLERANRRHPFITQPALRVELALMFIRGPTADPWKCAVRRGRPNEMSDEELWDEFFDSFCTAWIDDTPAPVTRVPSAPVDAIELDFASINPAPVTSPLPATLPTSVDEPLASVPITTDPPIPIPVGILKPAMTPSTVVPDSPPPRPPRSPRRPSSPRISLPPLLAVQYDGTQISPLPLVENGKEKVLPVSMPAPLTNPLGPNVAPSWTPVKNDGILASKESLFVPTPAPRAVFDPLIPTIVSTPTPAGKEEALNPCVISAPSLLVVPVEPCLRKRKHHDNSNANANSPRTPRPALDTPPPRATVADDGGPRTPFASRITSPPLVSTPMAVHDAPRVQKRKQEEKNETRPSKRVTSTTDVCLT